MSKKKGSFKLNQIIFLKTNLFYDYDWSVRIRLFSLIYAGVRIVVSIDFKLCMKIPITVRYDLEKASAATL